MIKDTYMKEVIAPGDKASKLAKDICVDSYHNNEAVEIVPRQPGNFRGAVDFLWKPHILQQMIDCKVFETVQNDGAGGKCQFFTLAGDEVVFYNLGWEIICMCADDIARSGGLAVILCNDINAKKVTEKNFHLVAATLRGYGDALRGSHLINITGEFAVMKHSVTAFCDLNSDKQFVLNWGGACIGLSHEDGKIDNTKIKPAMPIIGFWEPGYRCNGGTKFTNLILAKHKGNIKNMVRSKKTMDFIRKLTVPSQSYARVISLANGWKEDGQKSDAIIDIVGIAHITGGGVWGKFGEMLPEGVGARLSHMPEPAEVLLEAQAMSWDIPRERVTDWQAYSTFHGGCGMLIVCKTIKDAEHLIKLAKTFNIRAMKVGKTTYSDNNEIIINSRFQEGKELSSLHPE